jgi:hypothetical protein
MHRFHIERLNLEELSELKENRVQISNRFAALENLDDVDISRDWETIRENIKMSAKERLDYYEVKKLKPWFDKGCSELLDQR